MSVHGTFLPIHPQTRLDPSDGGEGTPTAGTAHHRLRSRVAAAMTCRRVVRSGDEHDPAEGLRFVSEMSQIGIGEMGRQTSRPHNDLLTGRTVGLLELCSFLPDCMHFVLREQTLQLDVLNGIG